ncbi:hypothetical protein A2691_00455 [Candidatus Woesebacteria bacterium RIFCSPHIGHO2_01_FULL_39_23]|nr:MAG: hypothetical protein A2691_00455 [Candidatus Woesebacteria bacterium RIFCSPHIGHO2_01_FULL_39_23]
MTPENSIPKSIGDREVNFRWSNPHFLKADYDFIGRVELARIEGGCLVVFLDDRDSNPLRTGSIADEDAGFHYALIAVILANTPADQAFEQTGDAMPLPIFAHITGFAEEKDGEYFLPNGTFVKVANLLHGLFNGRVYLADRGLFVSSVKEQTLVGSPAISSANIGFLRYIGEEIRDIGDDVRGTFKLLRVHRGDPGDQQVEVVDVLEYMKIIPRTARLGMDTVPDISDLQASFW